MSSPNGTSESGLMGASSPAEQIDDGKQVPQGKDNRCDDVNATLIPSSSCSQDETRADEPESRKTTTASQPERQHDVLPQMGSFIGASNNKNANDKQEQPSPAAENLAPHPPAPHSIGPPPLPGIQTHISPHLSPHIPIGPIPNGNMGQFFPSNLMGSPFPYGMYPMLGYPPMNGMAPNIGSWCQVPGPYGAPVLAWVPHSNIPPPPQGQVNISVQQQQEQLQDERDRYIDEQNKERLRLRELRREETLRKYMDATANKVDGIKPSNEDVKIVHYDWTNGASFSSNGASTKSSPESQSNVSSNSVNEKPSETQPNEKPQPKPNGSTLPDDIMHKDRASRKDRIMARKALEETFKKYCDDCELENVFPEHLADSAAVLANFKRGNGPFSRLVAHRQIEEEYAAQRKSFHKIVDGLQLPAIQNSNERWVCPLCPANSPDFLHYKRLLRHATTHLDVKPFKCPFCFKRFRRSDTARRHQSNCFQLTRAIQERVGTADTSSVEKSNKEIDKQGKSTSTDSHPYNSYDENETDLDELSEEHADEEDQEDSSEVREKSALPPVVMPIQK